MVQSTHMTSVVRSSVSCEATSVKGFTKHCTINCGSVVDIGINLINILSMHVNLSLCIIWGKLGNPGHH